ncbi:MAG: hypothetical protein ACKO69_07420, partial [Limnohabitans sp.]
MKQAPLSAIPPLLTDVIHVNASLRPATFPWDPKDLIKEALSTKPVQQALADEVIEKVHMRIAEMMPELIRDAVDQVLKQHDPSQRSQPKQNS